MISKLAIAGFVLGLVSSLLLLISFSGINIVSYIDEVLGIGAGEFTGMFTLIIILPIISIVSLILSIVSLVRIKKYGLKGKLFAIAGIITSSLPIIFAILIFINILSTGHF